MFKEIYLFELRQGFKKVSTYIYFFILFLLSLVLGLILSGVLPLASSDSNTYINSASGVTGILIGLSAGLLGLVNTLIMVSVMASGIQKDFQYNTHPLFFTKPLKKAGYFFGRFFGVFTIAIFVFSAQLIGYYLGCICGIGNDSIGPFHLANFIEPFVLFVIPNTLLLGIIIFSLTTFTRSTFTAYGFAVVLMVIRQITDSITSDIDNKALAALVEPFGQQAFNELTRYWTPDEQNNLLIPLQGDLLYNRLLWSAIAILITMVSFFKFSFSQFLVPLKLFSFRKKSESLSPASLHIKSLSQLPIATIAPGDKINWGQLFFLARFEFKKMVTSVFFVVIVLLGIALLFITSSFTGAIFGTETYPVTAQVMTVGAGLFQFFILILIIFYSGTMIWRERESKVDELVGSTPVKNNVLFFSKYLGIAGVLVVLLFIIMLSGIMLQFSKGYHHVEPLLYLKELFGFRFISLLIISGLALSVQVFLSNKYIGYFITLLIVAILPFVFGLLNWQNLMYNFNSAGPTMQYSDMNGYGHKPFTFFLIKTYWLAFTMILVSLALRFYARGKEKSFKARFKLSKENFTGKVKLAMIMYSLTFILCGSFIYYNIKVIHKFSTPKEQEKQSADFEKKYKRYEKTHQPRIVSSKLTVDIFPEERGAKINGEFYLKNKNKFPLDTIILQLNDEVKYTKIGLAKANKLVSADEEYSFNIYKLDSPLQPGDSIKLNFEIEYFSKGFRNDNAETSIVYNGTFFNSSLLPSIGYNPQGELDENDARTKYGLPKKERMPKVNDSLARMNNYISHDADWITFETTVSTSADQIALAPGYLQKDWEENGRHYFHYKMDCRILNFYAFLSARYEVKRDKWNGVNIEIYYNKGHEYNIDRMIKAIKKSLDYYTKNFSPYQHRQVRILEFPRYATFAQSFPNTIPFSESIGFIAKVDDKDPESIDYPFYVTAHEVAHQWWAHQVIGGNVQGATLMSETMSQYSALMVMEKEYGAAAMKKFLSYEMNQYLVGRSQEKKKELPLMLGENQQYLHYRKGSVVMYALKDYIGEDTLNAALRRYIKKTAFQEPPYTNSIEFISFLKQATPDSLKYIINDMFETITVFENGIKDLSYAKLPDGTYKVKLIASCLKYKADSLGKQKAVTVNDWIDVAAFKTVMVNGKKKDKELFCKKIKITSTNQVIEFIVKEKPTKAGIDPYNKLIDRTPDNNKREFGSKEGTPGTEGQSVTISVGG